MTLHVITLVTKEGCTLCEKVLAVLQASRYRQGYELRISAVGDDLALETKYLLRIPVVLVDGIEAFEAKQMDFEGLWVKKLERVLAGIMIEEVGHADVDSEHRQSQA